jgi:hypothetical protein
VCLKPGVLDPIWAAEAQKKKSKSVNLFSIKQHNSCLGYVTRTADFAGTHDVQSRTGLKPLNYGTAKIYIYLVSGFVGIYIYIYINNLGIYIYK